MRAPFYYQGKQTFYYHFMSWPESQSRSQLIVLNEGKMRLDPVYSKHNYAKNIKNGYYKHKVQVR